MAESIVAGLFGLTPSQIQQQQQTLETERAIQYAQLSPFERANMGMYQAGSQLANAGIGLMGIQNPQIQQSQQAEQIQRQIDHSTPEGLMQGAQMFNQAGNPRMAYMYQQAAQARQAELANISRAQAQQKLYEAQAQKAGKEEDLTKYGRLQKVEVGVEGKPDYRQQALYDPLTGDTQNIGAPYRVTAAIAAEAKAGAAATKQSQAEEKSSKAKETVNTLVATLKDSYDQLNKLGGIVSTERGALGNIAAQIGTTGAGQIAGGAIGTQTQKYRNQIKQTRPLLLNAIKEATGMTAKQMDSNVELKMYLDAATSPELGYEANIAALSNLDKLYGLGMGLNTPKPSQNAPASPNDLAAAARAELARRRGGK